ncbi:MAG: branched-chain amino acid ABC transporter permease [Dehalococcoidales bacterium]|nr:branched-chain amino acid ABC transporter permease [Dehalococcoidales bacterium]
MDLSTLGHLANGVDLGLRYVALALGLSIIFGMIGLVNFAHGAVYAVGAYVAMIVTNQLGFWPGLIISPIVVGLLGMILETTILRRFYKGIPELGLLFTFGLALFTEQALRWIFGSSPIPVQAPPDLAGPLAFGTFIYSKYRFFTVVATILVIAGLWWFLEKTPYGRVIRAGSRDPEMVRMLGINLSPVMTVVFGLGIALAGFAGLLAAPLSQVEPAMGNAVGTAAFVVVVIGGLGSFWGVVISGIIVGQVISLTRIFWPQMAEASIYFLMLLVLLMRPRGLFGERWERFE